MCRFPSQLFVSLVLGASLLSAAGTASAAVRIAMPPPPGTTHTSSRLSPAAEPALASGAKMISSSQYGSVGSARSDEVDVTDVGSLALARYSRARIDPDLMYVNGQSAYGYNGPTYFYDNWGWPFWWFGFSCSPCGSHGSCK